MIRIVKRISSSQSVIIGATVGSAVLLLLICLPLFRGEIHGGVDLTENDFPSRILYADGLKHGRLNLWNPQLFRGYRLHGEGQTGMCHPWHLLLYGLLPPTAALWLDLVAAFPLAFSGAFFLFRRWGLCRAAALFGASCLVFGSFFFSHFGHMSLLIVYAHLPWLLYFIDRAVRRAGPGASSAPAAPGLSRTACGGLIGVACVVASALLLGHPQMVWMLLLTGAVYAVVCADGRFFEAKRVRRGLWLVGAVAVGGVIGMIQILPTLAALMRSPRGELGPGMRYNFSLHPANVIQFFDPFFFAQTTVGNWLVPAAGRPPVFNNNIAEFSVYAGTVLLCLLGAVWLSRGRALLRDERQRLVRFLLCMGVLGVLLSLGRSGGLFVLVGFLPVVREFRCAARHIAFVQLACAGLGALAMHSLLSEERRRLPWRALLPVPVLSLCLGLAGIVLHGRVTDSRFLPSAWPLQLVGPAFGLGALALLAVWHRASWSVGLLVLLCLADLGVFGLRIVMPVPDVRLSEVRKLYRAYEHPPAINAELRLQAPANSGVWEGYYLANGYCGMPPAEPLDRNGITLRSLRLASVGRVWTKAGWKNLPDPLPRFRLVGKVVYDTQANRHLDIATTACLSDASRPLPRIRPGKGHVRLDAEIPTRIDLTVQTDTRQMLVCSDRFDSAWHATVDGVQVPILPLYNRALRGIVIPAGLHRVRMTYRSKAFRTGWALSAVGILLLAGFAAWCRRKRKVPCSAS